MSQRKQGSKQRQQGFAQQNQKTKKPKREEEEENDSEIGDDISLGEEEQANTLMVDKEIEEVHAEEAESEESDGFLTKDDVADKRKVIVVLEKCPLETARLGKDTVLLNSDEHKSYIIKKLKKDFSTYRPDIIHHSLLSLMDSPLNKAGFLQVYIHTESNVLIQISPNTKIPRTYKRFAALMAQLITKLKVRAAQSSETLLKIIKNPITAHLPAESKKIGMSTAARLVDFREYIEKLPKNKPVVFVVGGVSKGNPIMEIDYTDESICISKYGLSAGYCLARIMNCYEQMWGIV